MNLLKPCIHIVVDVTKAFAFASLFPFLHDDIEATTIGLGAAVVQQVNAADYHNRINARNFLNYFNRFFHTLFCAL